MQLLFLLIHSVFASENEKTKENSELNKLERPAQNDILVKIEEDEYTKKQTSQYFGVVYNKTNENWRARRWMKKARKYIYNGTYNDEETAAHASDTLARKLIANSEKGHKLNFPDDDTEMYPTVTEKTSIYVGVSYYIYTQRKKWVAQRRSKHEKKMLSNGYYSDEETAAHASDTLARKLISNGEKDHILNFPDDDTEVYPKKTSNYVGVSYNKQNGKWCAQRRSKSENKTIHNGTYKNEETAAHASDTLARKLKANGEKDQKLNFPDDDTEVYPEKIQNNKRKRLADSENSQKYGQSLNKFE